MKKILLISPQPYFQWRGSPIRVNFNVMALAELGYEVDLLTLPIGEDRDIEGVNVIRVGNPLKIRRVPIGPSLRKIFFDLLILFKGLGLIRKHKYAVIHGIEEAGAIAVFLGRLAGCKVIFEKHSDPFSYRKSLLKNILLIVYAFVEKMTVAWADAVICTGPGLVRQVEAMGKKTRAFDIFDIPSSLVEPEPGRVAAIRQRLRQEKGEVLVTFVGSFAVYQGVDLLIQAIPAAVKACPRVRFVIIGGRDEEIEERKAILREQGAAGKVSFIGKIPPDELPDYLSASDILLSPRISGVNTPLKLLDYFKAGRSIVATDVEANRLILNDELADFASHGPAALADAVCSLVADRERRETMGKKGRRLYERTYNFTNYVRKLKACYDSVQTGG